MHDETPVRHRKAKGADFSNRAKIRKLTAEGYQVAEISDMTQVDEVCVGKFVAHFRKELGLDDPTPEQPVDPEPEVEVEAAPKPNRSLKLRLR